MRSSPHRTEVRTVDRAENPFLRTMFRAAWTHLPVLLAGSAVVGLAVLATLVASAAWTVAAVVIGVLTVAPSQTALVAVGCAVLLGRDISVRDFGRFLGRFYGASAGLAAVPALLSGLTAIACTAWRRGGPDWLLLPIGLGLTVSVIALVGWLAAMPLRVTDDRTVTTRTWLLALHLFAHRPIPFIAAVALAAAGVWVSGHYSNALFLLVPAPVALTLAAAYLTVASEHGRASFLTE